MACFYVTYLLILPIIYQQKIMMYIGKDYSYRVGHRRGDYWFLIGFCAAVPLAVDMKGFLLDTLRKCDNG